MFFGVCSLRLPHFPLLLEPPEVPCRAGSTADTLPQPPCAKRSPFPTLHPATHTTPTRPAKPFPARSQEPNKNRSTNTRTHLMMATETTSYGTLVAAIHGDSVLGRRPAGRRSRWNPLGLFRWGSRAVRPASASTTVELSVPDDFGAVSQVAVGQASTPFARSGTPDRDEDDCCPENPCPICLVSECPRRV